MKLVSEIRESLLQVLFPHVCAGCGSDLLHKNASLCMRCMSFMPETNFECHAGNPIEKRFWGRLPLAAATAQYYFTRESLMQHLMHQFKYRGHKQLGRQLGNLMGEAITRSGRFKADALVPLPLFPAKEKRRGFNQATILCEGMSESLQVPVLKDIIIRSQHTDTQTKKGRIERWENMEGKFELQKPDLVHNKALILVDDVVTTGATLEACGLAILGAAPARLSIATLCYAAR